MVHALSCAHIDLSIHLRGLESTREARVALGYRLEQLARFFSALQTCGMHPELDILSYTHAKHKQILSYTTATTATTVLQLLHVLHVL